MMMKKVTIVWHIEKYAQCKDRKSALINCLYVIIELCPLINPDKLMIVEGQLAWIKEHENEKLEVV